MVDAIMNFRSEEFFDIKNKNYGLALTFESYSFCPHTHEFTEINIVYSGSGFHTLGNTRIRVKSGDIFVIPSGTVHSYENEDNLCVYHIILCDEFMKKYRDELSESPGYSVFFDIEPSFRSNTADKWFLNVNGSTLRYIESEIRKSCRVTSEKHYVLNNVIILNLICFLCGEMDSHISGNGRTLSDSGLSLIRAIEYIDKNISQKITVDELARISNMSASTFCRHFKKHLGIAPVTYIIQKRVNLAKRLISDGTSTKTEIAQICGFYDSSHMDKYL
ncbi:MAG: AraC family ligand binding domain-containing protein [Clostridia bacterium]|nr:AraC family ligand binding domain-containing protein [Clostridia bacterium]